MTRRIVITGIGLVTPIGVGVDEFWQSCLSGKSGIGKVSRFDAAGFGCQVAGEIEDFDPTAFVHNSQIRSRLSETDRLTHLALAGARLAEEDAAITLERENNCALFLGVAVGGVGVAEAGCRELEKGGWLAVNDNIYSSYVPGAALGMVAAELGISGPGVICSNGCTASTDAIGAAFHEIVQGRLEVAIAGGAEAPIVPMVFAAFDVIHALTRTNEPAERACRPFDKTRDGFVLSEGSAYVILEEFGHALRRGARIYAEVVGHAGTINAYHMTAPKPDGAENIRAMRMALREAGLVPEAVDYVNVHGSGTQLNDEAETTVLKRVFGDHANRLLISSTKSMCGHSLGAAGAVEIAATCLAIRDQIAPPTINYCVPDPACDLDCVPNKAREARIDVAVKNACGFSGLNAVVVLRRLPEDRASSTRSAPIWNVDTVNGGDELARRVV